MSPRMLEGRGHSGDVALWSTKQWSLWTAVLQLLVLDGQSWGLFGGVLIFSPTFCCTKGNPHNPEGKLLYT